MRGLPRLWRGEVCKKERLMKYKVIKSDILLNGKLIPENSEVELSEADTKGIEDYLQICHSERSEESLPDTSNINFTNEKQKIKRGNK